MAGGNYEILPLSGSTDGRGKKVAATTSGGADTIHTVPAGGGVDIDLIDLWAVNSDTQGRTLTLLVGGTTNPDDYIVVPVPNGAGLVMVCERLVLRNSLILKAFADLTNVITLFGKIVRIDK